MKEAIKQTLIDLIRFKSTPDRPEELQACANYIANFFEGSGLLVERFESNGVPSVIVTKGTKTPRVFLNGHFDVVPAQDSQFEPIEKEEKLFGRGSFDMKSGNAVMMHIMRDLAKTDHDVGLMLTGDEEIGGANGVSFLLKDGYSCDVVVIPDGGESLHRVVVKEKGVLRAHLIARGTQAHASRLWNGDNAIDRLCDALVAIRSAFMPMGDHPTNHWVTTSSLGIIKGGEAVNQVPDYAEAVCDIRYTDDDTVFKVEERIKKVLPEGIELIIDCVAQNVSTDREHPLFKSFSNAVESLGLEVELTCAHGASDGRFFAERGIPIVMNQPDGGNAHAKDEWVDLEAVELYDKILRKYLDDVAQ